MMEQRKVILLGLERVPFIFGTPAYVAQYRYSAKFLVVHSTKVFELNVKKEEFEQLRDFFDGAFDLHFYFDFEFGKEKVNTSGTSESTDMVDIGKLNDVKAEQDKSEEKKGNDEIPF